MISGLSVTWHDPTDPAAPPGWAEAVAAQRLPGVWDWPVVHAVAVSSRIAVLVATLHDGPAVRGLVTGRFPGLRTSRGAVPLAGVVDIDCLSSSAMPGIMLAGPVEPELRVEAVAVLRDAVRREYGRRARGLMFRKLDQAWLPAVLSGPAVVGEGMPVAVFRNRFADFDSYVASLSRSRRWSLRKMLRELDADPELAVSFTGRQDRPATVPVRDACRLQAMVVDRNHRSWLLRKRLMPPDVAHAQLASPRAHRVAYHDTDGRLLAFSLLWDHPEWPHGGAWGALTPAEAGRDGLWFHVNALFVRWCIETGRAGVVFGQGSIENKRRLGYEMWRQWAVLMPQRHRRGRRVAAQPARRSPTPA